MSARRRSGRRAEGPARAGTAAAGGAGGGSPSAALVVVVIASLGALAWSAAERQVAAASTGDNAARSGWSGALCVAGPLCPGAVAYVAVPGDTVWSIAVRYAHGADPRPLAERLEAELGGGVLQPGQRLSVP